MQLCVALVVLKQQVSRSKADENQSFSKGWQLVLFFSERLLDPSQAFIALEAPTSFVGFVADIDIWLNMPFRCVGVYQVNQYLKVGLFLGLLQFLVFFSGWDHLVKVGPYRAHHFIELPAFYFLGRGFIIFFHDLGCNNRNTLLGALGVYLFTILVNPQGWGLYTMLAAIIVSFPYLVGAAQQIAKYS